MVDDAAYEGVFKIQGLSADPGIAWPKPGGAQRTAGWNTHRCPAAMKNMGEGCGGEPATPQAVGLHTSFGWRWLILIPPAGFCQNTLVADSATRGILCWLATFSWLAGYFGGWLADC